MSPVTVDPPPPPPTGYFMYIEASLMRPGHKARLLTSDLRGSSSPQCLVFYLHMYGSGTGILSVLLRRGGPDALLWRRRGEQSVSWMRAMVDYRCDVRHQVRRRESQTARCPSSPLVIKGDESKLHHRLGARIVLKLWILVLFSIPPDGSFGLHCEGKQDDSFIHFLFLCVNKSSF